MLLQYGKKIQTQSQWTYLQESNLIRTYLVTNTIVDVNIAGVAVYCRTLGNDSTIYVSTQKKDILSHLWIRKYY